MKIEVYKPSQLSMGSFAAESRRFKYTLASKMVNFGLIMAPIAAFEAIRRPGRPVNNKNIRKSQSEPLEIQLMLKESLEDKITFLRNWGHSEVAPEISEQIYQCALSWA